MNDPKFIIQISKGLIRDQRARRMVMFYSILIALVMIFVGSVTFSKAWALEHPILFMGFWGACAWITLLAVLLALYDMLKVRGEAQRERRRLERELATKLDEENPGDRS